MPRTMKLTLDLEKFREIMTFLDFFSNESPVPRKKRGNRWHAAQIENSNDNPIVTTKNLSQALR